ncbi:MAG: hypothetical protein HYX54_01220 [Chloroflexi bacterium]|nr:hypothetical protein [Chloroflexota bacterium]
MNEPFETDPLDVLRAANPVRDDHLPSASLARIRARVQEDVMQTTKTSGLARPARLLGAAIGGAAVAALAFIFVFGSRGAAPAVLPGSSAGTGSASCVEQYSPTALAARSFAFDGTVTSISGDRVTFAVNAGYKGADTSTITLDAPGMTGTEITSAGGPNLAVGARYLVAGDATFVWACGFTRPYDATIAAQWSTAFGG